MYDDTLKNAAFARNLINYERYVLSTKGSCSPRLEHTFIKRSMAMTAHVDLLCCSTVSCTRMPPSITVFIHRISLMNVPCLTLWGLLAGGSPHLKLQALVLTYSGDPKGRFHTVFSLGAIPINKCPLFLTFGGCWQWEGPN